MKLIIIVSMLLLISCNAASADYWDTSWGSRQEIILTGNTSGAQTDYQVLLNVSWVTGMQTDFDDLRFVDDANIIDSWLESKVDNSYAHVWVEFPTTPADGVNQTYYMYYGNDGANSYWDIEDTMVFGDDFSGAVLDTTRWDSYIKGDGSSITLSGGEGIFLSSDTNRENYAAVLSKNSFGVNNVLESRAKFGTVANNAYKYPTIGFGPYEGSAAIYLKSRTPIDDSILFMDFSSASSLWGYSHYINGAETRTVGESISTSYKTFSIERYDTSKARWLINGVEVKGETVTIPESTQIAFGIDATTSPSAGAAEITMYCDWIFVRKYAANSPISSFGNIQHYAKSIHYNVTLPYNHTIDSTGVTLVDRTVITADDIGWTVSALTDDCNLIVTEYNLSNETVTNFSVYTATLDVLTITDLDNFRNYNLSFSNGTFVEEQISDKYGNISFVNDLTTNSYTLISGEKFGHELTVKSIYFYEEMTAGLTDFKNEMGVYLIWGVIFFAVGLAFALITKIKQTLIGGK